MNTGLIVNLPSKCCVEVPCLVDGTGITPCYAGELPAQLAALNRSNIAVQELAVQELAVQSALTGDKEAAVHAVLLDPLTSSLMTCDKIKEMVLRMFDAEKEYLPQFK